jgi:hypothetical protein
MLSLLSNTILLEMIEKFDASIHFIYKVTQQIIEKTSLKIGLQAPVKDATQPTIGNQQKIFIEFSITI